MSSLEQTGNPEVIFGITTLQYQKETVDALLALASANLGKFLTTGSSLLPAGRNVLIRAAYEQNPDFTHFMFIDDDMSQFTPQHVAKLVMNDKDICSALVNKRNPPYEIVARFMDEDLQELLSAKALTESEICGMAFTVIKRKVLDTLREETRDGPIWFHTDRLSRPGFEDERKEFNRICCIGPIDHIQRNIQKAIDFGISHSQGSPYIGEDAQFCHRAREKGFKVFVDCGVIVGHMSSQTIKMKSE